MPPYGIHRSAERWFGCLIAVLLLLIYNPVLRYSYAMLDDYTFLKEVHYGGTEAWQILAATGRPLYAFLAKGLFTLADSIAGLAMVRGVSLIGLVGFATLWYRSLRRTRWSIGMAFGVILVTLGMPVFGLLAGWATLFHASLALGVGFWAGEQAVWALLTQDRRRLSYASGGLLAALFLYQPSALAYWLAFAVYAFRPQGRMPCLVRRFLGQLGLFGAVMVGYFVLYKAVSWTLFADPLFAGVHARTTLTTDPVTKLQWFLTEALPVAATPWIGADFRLWAMPIVAVAVLGMVIHLRRTGDWWLGLVWLALPLLAFQINLLNAENTTVLRVMPVLSALVVFYALWGLRRLAGEGL